jgi:hypothetical protein
VGRFPGRGFFVLSQNRGRNCPRFFVFGVLKQMNQNQDEIKPLGPYKPNHDDYNKEERDEHQRGHS